MGKNILMVIAPQGFADKEYFTPRRLFDEAGFSVTVASQSTDTSIGMHGGAVKPDMLLEDVNIDSYDAIVISGGNGVPDTLWEDVTLRKHVVRAYDSGKVVAAICVSPVILARAGVLKDKKATVFTWDKAIEELEKNGAVYEDLEVAVSGNVVTGRNPDASKAFGEKLCQLLKA